MITGRQHSLWSTHIVLFLHTAPSRKQEISNHGMAFLCCQQKWSTTHLHMKWGIEAQWNLMGLTYLLVVYHINWCAYICRQHYKTVVTLICTHNKEDYITQVQVSMSTLPMQQVCPERAQNASDKQQTMQANLANGLQIKSTGSHEVLHHGQLTKIGCKVQGCVSVIIRVKEVALHLGG